MNTSTLGLKFCYVWVVHPNAQGKGSAPGAPGRAVHREGQCTGKGSAPGRAGRAMQREGQEEQRNSKSSAAHRAAQLIIQLNKYKSQTEVKETGTFMRIGAKKEDRRK